MAVVVLAARDVCARRDGREVLINVSLSVRSGEHWALLGANGAGKSTLLSMLGAWRFPSSGSVSVLGVTLGRGDVRELRRGIGWVDPRLPVRPDLSVTEVVLTGATATTELLVRRDISAVERSRAAALLALMGVDEVAGQRLGSLSAGERGRTLIARALLSDPALLLLDEPFTGLDLPGRERLRARLATLADEQPALASVMVTHHLEELPATTTHTALLRDGRLLAAGPVADVLTSEALSDTFALPIAVTWRDGRWNALARFA